MTYFVLYKIEIDPAHVIDHAIEGKGTEIDILGIVQDLDHDPPPKIVIQKKRQAKKHKKSMQRH